MEVAIPGSDMLADILILFTEGIYNTRVMAAVNATSPDTPGEAF
jgi:hypothetical protein